MTASCRLSVRWHHGNSEKIWLGIDVWAPVRIHAEILRIGRC